MQTWVLTREQSRSVDRLAIEEFEIPGIVLMENAGRGAAECLLARGLPGPVGILCGPGNNGGDGYVVARHLSLAGIEVRLFHTRSAGELRGDALTNRRIVDHMGLPAFSIASGQELERARGELEGCSQLIDALLGTGSRGAPRGVAAEAIGCINDLGREVLALDLPSGLDADTGQAAMPTVRANRTLTFCTLKTGLVEPAAREYCGEVEVVPIGVPLQVIERALES